MNNHDPFEKRLEALPLRRLPAAWRQEVLAAARKESALPEPGVVPAPSLAACLGSWLSKALWPHPAAWTGLAALWLLILGLNLTMREASPRQVAHRDSAPSPEMRMLWRQQEQLLAEMVGPIEKPQARHSKPVAPEPHSQRREDFLNA